MLKNISKNRSKSASASNSINNSPGCFSENSSTSFSSKVYVQSPEASKKSPDSKLMDVKSPEPEKPKPCDDIDADSESEEVLKKSTKKSLKRSKNLKKKSKNKVDLDEPLIEKSSVENYLEPTTLNTFNCTESSEIAPSNDSSIVESNALETSNQRITRKRNSLRNIVTNKFNVLNNNSTDKVPDKVHPKLSSSKLEKIVKSLEYKAENKDDDKDLSDCDKDEEENGEIPLDLRLQALSNKRAHRDAESKKNKPETVPPLFIVFNNDKLKKPKKSSKNMIAEKEDEISNDEDGSCSVDSKSQYSTKASSKSKSKKEARDEDAYNFEDNMDEDNEASRTLFTRKPSRRKHSKDDESLSSYLNDEMEEPEPTVVKRKRLGSRRKSKKDSTEEHDKETAIKKSCMVRKALYKLKEKFQLDDEDEEDSATTERENESDTNQEGDDENIDKTDDDISEKKARVLHKTVLRTKIPLEEINDDTLLQKISDHEDIEENRKKIKAFPRTLRTKSHKDETEENDANKNNEEEQSKDISNFSVLKKFRTSPRKVKSIPSNDSSSSDIPNISMETIDSSVNTSAKVTLKRGRPKKVNSSSTSVCSDDNLMSDSGAQSKIDIVNNNDTSSITSYNLEVAEEKSISGDEAPEGLTKHKHFVKNIPKKRKTIKNMPISTDTDRDGPASPTHDESLGEGLNGIMKVS